MKTSSTEKHERTHAYTFSQDELQRLALEKVVNELGLDLSNDQITCQSSVVPQSSPINPTTYVCKVFITESLECQD